MAIRIIDKVAPVSKFGDVHLGEMFYSTASEDIILSNDTKILYLKIAQTMAFDLNNRHEALFTSSDNVWIVNADVVVKEIYR